MIAMAPGDDAWGFLVPVYQYQAGRERERGGPPTPVHPLSLEISCHDLEADPCPPVFRKNPGDPYPQEECRPLSISGKVGGFHTRVHYIKIYVYKRKLLIYSNIRDFIVFSHLVKIY